MRHFYPVESRQDWLNPTVATLGYISDYPSLSAISAPHITDLLTAALENIQFESKRCHADPQFAGRPKAQLTAGHNQGAMAPLMPKRFGRQITWFGNPLPVCFNGSARDGFAKSMPIVLLRNGMVFAMGATQKKMHDNNTRGGVNLNNSYDFVTAPDGLYLKFHMF